MPTFYIRRQNELYHYGIKGQKWGVRRYQNEDGSLTEEGKRRLGRAIDLKLKYNRADERSSASMRKQQDYLKNKKGYSINYKIEKSTDRSYYVKPFLKDKKGNEVPKSSLKKLYDTDKEYRKLTDISISDYNKAKKIAEEYDAEYGKVKNISLGVLQGTINDYWDDIVNDYDNYKKLKVNSI